MSVAIDYDLALQEAARHLGADSGTIHVKDPGAMMLRLAARLAIPDPVAEIVREVPWGKGMAGLAAERAQPVDACNIQTTDSSDVRPGARATGVQGAIVVPILFGDQVVGTLGVGCLRERTFTPEETGWLLDFGRALGDRIGDRS